MNDERLKEIKDSIEFQMIVEQNSDYKENYNPILKEEIDLYNEVVRLHHWKDNLIKYIEGMIDTCDGFIDTTESDLEELKYTIFASNNMKELLKENKLAKKIYQDLLERIKSGKYE